MITIEEQLIEIRHISSLINTIWNGRRCGERVAHQVAFECSIGPEIDSRRNSWSLCPAVMMVSSQYNPITNPSAVERDVLQIQN